MCMSKQKLMPPDFLLVAFLVEAGSLTGQRTDCLDYLVRKPRRSSRWQFPSAGGQVRAAIPGSLHGSAGPELRASCVCSEHCTDQAISPATKLFTFIIGCNHKILKRLLWREWIQTFRNNNIHAAYPEALVLLLLKYKIMHALPPAPVASVHVHHLDLHQYPHVCYKHQ